MDETNSRGTATVQAIRAAGFPCREVGDLKAWAGAHPFGIAVLISSSRSGLANVRRLKNHYPGVSSICLIEESSIENSVLALNTGAESVLDARTSEQTLVSAIEAASAGMSLIQVELLRLVLELTPDRPHLELSAEHLDLLRLIVKGSSTETIAEVLKCSRRTAYRKMDDLYRAIGAENREHAAYLAGRWHLADILDR